MVEASIPIDGHKWINSLTSIIALGASITAVGISWQTYLLKREDLVLLAEGDPSCLVDLRPLSSSAEMTQIPVCWTVVAENNSDEKINLVRAELLAVDLLHSLVTTKVTPSVSVEKNTQQSLPLSITIDAGSSLRLFVQASIPISTRMISLLSRDQLGPPDKYGRYRSGYVNHWLLTGNDWYDVAASGPSFGKEATLQISTARSSNFHVQLHIADEVYESGLHFLK